MRTTRALLTRWLPGVLLAVAAVAPLVIYWTTNPDDQRLVDLEVYRLGGEMALTGRPVYDAFTPAPQLLPFTYPPIAALLAVPLALMSWPVAQWVWIALIYLTLAVTVAYSFRRLLPRAGAWAPVACGALVAATAYLMPIRDQTRFGQVDVILVALCLADCAARNPRWPRGLLIGIATAVKLTPGVFLIYLWISGRRRAAVVAAATTAALTLLPFAIIPGDAADFWFSALLDSERLGANKATTNQSMRGMLLRLYLPEPLSTLIWLALVAVVAWYGFRAARRASLDGHEITGAALTGLMAVLLSPVAWIHHLAWIVLALGALAGEGRDRARLLMAAAVAVFYTVPVPWYGVSLLTMARDTPWLVVPGKIVQDGYGLGALALVWILAVWLRGRRPEVAVGPAGSARE
ncbi:glycosyltransferase 87 family protein [Bailinhaonella thermotolerans]|uniref:glycosyltransferase 87 family protein n=1 Tax=Bailinhaonella thermotolerans TaxID=1070861 RepID=UPI001F5B2E3C|nr:glycosyltransferase 87 family protein [Bailinhaonella thermotolerans]